MTSRHPGLLSVLVLGDRTEVALPACRALAEAGHLVGVGVSRQLSPVIASRSVRACHRLPGPAAPPSLWSQALHDVVEQVGYDVVLACSDVDVLRLTTSEVAVALVPDLSRRQNVLLDKGELAQLSARVGVGYPRTYVPTVPSDDRRIAEALIGPVVVKPARPAVETERGVSHVQGARRATGPRDILAALEACRAGGHSPIVQEDVGGEKLQAVVIRRAATTTCRLVVAVERELPPEVTLRQVDSAGGAGGQCIEALERIADAVGYEGILQAELVAQPDGSICVIDINPRLWGGLPFAELIGLRVADRVVRDAMGLPAHPLPAERPGRRYHHVWRELTYLRFHPRALPEVASEWWRGSGLDVWDVPASRDVRPELARLRARVGG